MKKILIIQTDPDYFLFETLHAITIFQKEFTNCVVDLLINIKSVPNLGFNLSQFNVIDLSEALGSKYDVSFNLSLNEESWSIHGQIESEIKNGAYYKDKDLIIPDLWSTYLMTLKSNQPFVTLHLRDIYKNVLSIKSLNPEKEIDISLSKIIYSFSDPEFFSADEQEKFIHEIARKYKGLPIYDISEMQGVDDFKDALYIGPPQLNALVGCTHLGLGVYLTEKFQGFNLIPYGPQHLIVSGAKQKLNHHDLLSVINEHISGNDQILSHFAIYSQTNEHLFGSFLKAHSNSDEAYPIYCSQVVLWNFLLNLIDTPLDQIRIKSDQKLLLQNLSIITDKVIRLYGHVLDSLNIAIKDPNPTHTQNALEKTVEVDQITHQVSESNSLLRSLLDFYRLRRSQPYNSTNALEEALLLYTEEQQALLALQELFNSTINSNNVKI